MIKTLLTLSLGLALLPVSLGCGSSDGDLVCVANCPAPWGPREHPPVPPPGGQSSLDNVAVGSRHLGDLKHEAQSVVVTIPDAGVVSATVLATASDRSAGLYVTKIIAPDGTKLVSVDDSSLDQFTQGLNSSALLVVPARGAFAINLGGSPATPLLVGDYHITYASTVSSDVTFNAVLKRVQGDLGAGRLPVTLWFANSSHLSASAAPQNRDLQAALGVFRDLYAGAGITIEPGAYRAMNEPDASRFAVLRSRDDLDALCRVADGADEGGLHLFFVDSMELADGGPSGSSYWGLSNGIPGAPTYAGLAHGCVAVALAHVHEAPTEVGLAIAHETGHYLGLPHSSERDGSAFDRFGDTSECRLDSDTNHDGFLSAAECAHQDGLNLMFWTTDPTLPSGNLTAEQAWVLLRSPLVVSP